MATFKTRARTLDMLGRQQIAGRPTAISELFKNAHDAYADHVEVDYYRADGLFVLRDDGLGMTKVDFEGRWLTLGTESKVNSQVGIGPPPIDPSKPIRPILGEKGIGRLAIAAIGPQVLILTRAKQGNVLHDLVVAFLNWGIFECPGLDLDQIEIPLRTFSAGSLPNSADINEMVEAFRDNIRRLSAHIDPHRVEKIEKELAAFKVDPQEIDGYLGTPSLKDEGHGTHFIILPADQDLEIDIEDRGDEYDVAPPLLKMLLGFTNTMTPNHEPQRIVTSFRYHKTDEIYEDLIGEGAFFTPAEFSKADHHIEGVFDKYGQFSGTVTVYGKTPVQHSVAWLEARGKQTDCGPFEINVAYVQGKSSESLLPIEEWGRLSRKLNKIGGIYIYKDGIRVLPYGNTDYDFLEIERNRTKSASYYFFSYRRMFGIIEISGDRNPNLTEKAGRESFRENRAYSQFKEILKNFFVQIAADFFREEGAKAETFLAVKTERDLIEKARKRREKQVTTKRNAFRSSLDKFFERIDTNLPVSETEKLLTSVKQTLEVAISMSDPDRAGQEFISAELNARRKLNELRSDYKIIKPRGVGLSKQLARDWNAYQLEYQRIENNVFSPASQQIEILVGELARNARLAINSRRRVEAAIREQIASAQKTTNADGRETRETAEDIRARVLQLTRKSILEVEDMVKQVEIELARMQFDGLDDGEVVRQRDMLESQIITAVEEKRQLLENIREQLRSIDLTPDEHGRLVGINETTEALEEEVLALRERADADVELTQLGMAIGVINHEFEGTVQSIRNNLRRLKAWADINADLRELYSNIRASFDHLDGYLTLFTPLHRRLYRQPVEISGSDIAKFLKDLFSERVRRHNVTIEAKPGFMRKKIIGYPSTFYPVFVNLVDNAIYWLKNRSEPRVVTLDADGDALIVSDTGPGIPERDREAVFEYGFTKKVGGRGMGLYISREVLHEAGYNLVFLEAKPGEGATFRIEPDRSNDITTDVTTEEDV